MTARSLRAAIGAAVIIGGLGALAVQPSDRRASGSVEDDRFGRYRISQECMSEMRRLGRPENPAACRVREPWWRRW